MVCVVFRASPLIWPTPYLAHTTRPGPSTRCTPGGFPRGAMGVGARKAPLLLGSTYRSTGWGEGLRSLYLIACSKAFHPACAKVPLREDALTPDPSPRGRGESAALAAHVTAHRCAARAARSPSTHRQNIPRCRANIILPHQAFADQERLGPGRL
jgi:hypothetical protein